MTPVLIGALIVGGIVGLVILFFVGHVLSLWFQALISGAGVSILSLVAMRFRKVRPEAIVLNRISAKKAGLDISTDQLESHYLSGGRVNNVVRAMIAADKAGIDLPWTRATAIDLG
jgi:uncharacterized protein YqfA (UPF0365 family)